MKTRILLAAVACILAAAVASGAYADLSPGTKAPDFTLPTLNGKTFKLSDCFKTKPKVVVLDLWATWCGPCRAEIPYLIDLHNKFKDKGAAVVGVALDREKSTVASFARDKKINYTVALDPQGSAISADYKVRGIPATYVIDKKGVIRYAHSGFPSSPEEAKKEASQLEQEVKTLLAEK